MGLTSIREGHSQNVVFSLYRSYVRQVNRLPHVYLRQFFRLKVADDARSLLRAKDDAVRRSKYGRVEKDLRKLVAANSKDRSAFDHILDVAYGRTGRLRWEIMKPLLHDPNTPSSPDSSPRNAPPVYSPELAALLKSTDSRRTKSSLSPKDLETPPNMPARYSPLSEEALLLGPFSKRRERNIRRRFFDQEWKKIYPPLEVTLRSSGNAEVDASSLKVPEQFGVRSIGLQGSRVLEDAILLAGSSIPHFPRPRRESALLGGQPEPEPAEIHNSQFDSDRLPSRWTRRRYKSLLARLPKLNYNTEKKSYYVNLDGQALITRMRPTPRQVDDGSLTWMDGGTQTPTKGRSAKKASDA